jgi:Transposase IS4
MSHEEEDGRILLHGTMVLKKLVFPWVRTSRIVCADSYFSMVGAAEELLRIGLRFIGVVKTAKRPYPMKTLSSLELHNRGDSSGLLLNGPDGHPKMLAFTWMDRDRRYFISTASSLYPGRPYVRDRWRQVDQVRNAPPVRVDHTIPQPEAAEICYDTCGMIDRHNRSRQDDLSPEKKLGTMDWSMRVNMTVLGMVIVDSWLAWNGCRGLRSTLEQKKFYEVLAEELIDNNFDAIGIRERHRFANESEAMLNGQPRSGIGIHLTPTKKKRRTKDGDFKSGLRQGRCLVCRRKTTMVCSQCKDMDLDGPEAWLCATRTGRACFPTHSSLKHNT